MPAHHPHHHHQRRRRRPRQRLQHLRTPTPGKTPTPPKPTGSTTPSPAPPYHQRHHRQLPAPEETNATTTGKATNHQASARGDKGTRPEPSTTTPSLTSSDDSSTLGQEWRGDNPTRQSRTQRAWHPHHRSTTTGTNRQHTTSNIADDAYTQSTTDTNITISVTNATDA